MSHASADAGRNGRNRSPMDSINRRAWRRRDAVWTYAHASGWLDPGEQRAIEAAAAGARGGRVLDIGVGGGRTIELLRGLGAEYVAIDYTSEQVAAARQRHPDADIRLMDARALDFPEAHFDLVAFSFNGIDSVDLEGRRRILAEVRRVLRPGGRFVFSALNRNGPSHRHRDGFAFTWNPARAGRNLLRSGRHLLRELGYAVRSLANRLRLGRLARVGEQVSVINIAAHYYGVLAVHTSLAEQRRQLEAAGYILEAVFDSVTGADLAQPEADAQQSEWLHFVARKPPG